MIIAWLLFFGFRLGAEIVSYSDPQNLYLSDFPGQMEVSLALDVDQDGSDDFVLIVTPERSTIAAKGGNEVIVGKDGGSIAWLVFGFKFPGNDWDPDSYSWAPTCSIFDPASELESPSYPFNRHYSHYAGFCLLDGKTKRYGWISFSRPADRQDSDPTGFTIQSWAFEDAPAVEIVTGDKRRPGPAPATITLNRETGIFTVSTSPDAVIFRLVESNSQWVSVTYPTWDSMNGWQAGGKAVFTANISSYGSTALFRAFYPTLRDLDSDGIPNHLDPDPIDPIPRNSGELGDPFNRVQQP